MVSPTNTAPDLTDPSTPGYLRVVWNDKQQGEVAAEYAYSIGLTKAATMWDNNDPYSVGLAQSFKTAFQTAGGTITMEKTITANQTDMRTELIDIANSVPHIVYFPVFMPAGGYIINQARVIPGLKFSDGVRLMGSDGLYDQSVMLSTGSDLEGFLITGIDSTQFASNYAAPGGFIDDYAVKYGVPPSDTTFGAYGYDAFNIVKAAIETSAVDLTNGNYMIGRQALRNALYATSGIVGLTGTLTCDPGGDCANTPALGVYQYTAGVNNPAKIWP
jgi:branched-chain amino acid transport system substrate-binding protein